MTVRRTLPPSSSTAVADAAPARKIWDGPRTASAVKLCSGLAIGVGLKGLAATNTVPQGGARPVSRQGHRFR